MSCWRTVIVGPLEWRDATYSIWTSNAHVPTKLDVLTFSAAHLWKTRAGSFWTDIARSFTAFSVIFALLSSKSFHLRAHHIYLKNATKNGHNLKVADWIQEEGHKSTMRGISHNKNIQIICHKLRKFCKTKGLDSGWTRVISDGIKFSYQWNWQLRCVHIWLHS